MTDFFRLLSLIIIFVQLMSSTQASFNQETEENMELTRHSKILIIGGGLAGLSIAKALEDKGYNPHLVEKRKKFKVEGTGIAIPANGAWALDQLNISYKKHAHLIERMRFTDEEGNILNDEDVTEIHKKGSQFYSIDRSSLHEILEKSLKHTRIDMGVTVRGFEEDDTGIKVFFSNLTQDCYDLMIAADGANSWIRRLCEPSYQLCSLGLHVWRTIVSTPENFQHPTYMLGKDCVFLLYPLNNDKTYIYAHKVKSQLPVGHLKTVRDDIIEVFKDFGGFVPGVLQKLRDEKPRIYSQLLFTSSTIKWSHGKRILLVGDASHTFSPMLQNGAAQAFEDAYVLKNLLKEINNIPDLLQSFAERRNERVAWVKEMSDQKIVALSQEQVNKRNQKIREGGAPNISAFKILMAENP